MNINNFDKEYFYKCFRIQCAWSQIFDYFYNLGKIGNEDCLKYSLEDFAIFSGINVKIYINGINHIIQMVKRHVLGFMKKMENYIQMKKCGICLIKHVRIINKI